MITFIVVMMMANRAYIQHKQKFVSSNGIGYYNRILGQLPPGHLSTGQLPVGQ